jgi:uncharacterized protein with FMN-binding domain
MKRITPSQKITLGLAALGAGLASQAQAAAPLHDGTFDGQAYDAYYGPVQVEVTIQQGQISNVQALQSPNHRRTSVAINNEALPMLLEEVIQAQSAKIDLISGATLTSRAYVASLADALKQARK